MDKVELKDKSNGESSIISDLKQALGRDVGLEEIE
jgi:hypothetical protein